MDADGAVPGGFCVRLRRDVGVHVGSPSQRRRPASEFSWVSGCRNMLGSRAFCHCGVDGVAYGARDLVELMVFPDDGSVPSAVTLTSSGGIEPRTSKKGQRFMRGFKNLVLGGMAALTTGATWAAYSWTFPQPVTPIAHETLHVHNLFMVIALTLFFGVLALMLYSFYVHRKSRGAVASDFTAPKSRKQWLWVLSPFVALLILDYGVFGIPAYHAVKMYEDTKTDAELVVKVTGSQWLWQYEFPSEGVRFSSRLSTPREQIENRAPKGEHYLLEVDNPLVLPVGKKIRFITTSNDVIHSWWVPAFGVKRDAVPGFLREFWAKVDTVGTYRGQCSELCGKEHGFMPVVVHVVPEAEFKTWLESKKTGAVAVAAKTTP